ncbi:hypothetical protein [Mucilaginibacter paludis]|uniref:Cytochrome c domain-containing protein n=1 Tax=Mucilaginibacter paludis DSM 18603 TaxID=714943 RepID=H1YE13_9SPHI|nr:hypothetical protein [Mucilaginibacter paludis]EHQ25191.1 hypothetical protein Mucpa_1017 [Mucilaginibacter paludis DSM 18603]
MKNFKKIKPLLIIGSLLLIVIACSTLTHTDGQDAYLNFPEKLTPVTPYDVDTSLERKLLHEQKFAEAQRLFEVLSWQMFISLNWPVNDKGEPKADITDAGKRIWEGWKESYEVFRVNGDKPHVWGSKADLPDELKGMKVKEGEEVLYRTSKFAEFKDERWKRGGKGRKPFIQPDDVDQAFTSPIWDQSGNVVRYEIRLNKPTVKYITDSVLYNFDGQIAFYKHGSKVAFPSGTVDQPGSIELKFAWKILVPGKDIFERYFAKKVIIPDPKNPDGREVTVGLVGMHIGTKTVSSPQWIWATFEQVDNVATDALQKIDGHYLKPSFYDPDCATCPVNLYPSSTPKKNQIQRIFPIPLATQNLNKQVQALLKQKKSFWQYYELIGTQWPTDPTSPAYPLNASVYKLPDAVANKSGGKPTPVFLTNMVMETYFQGGTNIDSTSNYNKYIANEPAYFQIEGSPHNDPANTNKMIFGTEGCVNCHSSASIAIGDTLIGGIKTAKFGPPRIGDFEWLLQRKAHFKTSASTISTSKK